MKTLVQKPSANFGQLGIFSDTFTEPVKGKISVFDNLLATPTITWGLDFSVEESNDSVEKFLKNNPTVAFILADAKQAVPKYFGDVGICTEIFFDPETEDNEGALFLIVKTRDDPMTALEKLNHFDANWLTPRISGTGLKFNVDIEPY